jgi:hypothetical protein
METGHGIAIYAIDGAEAVPLLQALFYSSVRLFVAFNLEATCLWL